MSTKRKRVGSGSVRLIVVALLFSLVLPMAPALAHSSSYCGHTAESDGNGNVSDYQYGWGSGLSHGHHYHHYYNGYYTHGRDLTCPEPW